MMLLFFIFAVGILAVLGLIRAGSVIFANEVGIDPDGASVPKVDAPSTSAKNRALIQAIICAIALLGCGLVYELGYNSPAAKAQRLANETAELCVDVLAAYKAGQTLIRQVDKAALSFPFIPAPASKALGNCEFRITGSAERVSAEGGVIELILIVIYAITPKTILGS